MATLREQHLHTLQRAALAAGEHLLLAAKNRSVITTSIKPDKSIVLNLDLESQQIIRQVLGTTYPIVSEEDESSHAHVGSKDPYWIIDPLDGTTSCKRFLGQFDLQVGFGPLVGFIEEGVVSIAAFYSVPQRSLYYALKGEGCFCVELSGDSIATQSLSDLLHKKLVIADTIPIGEGAVLFYAGEKGEIPLVEKLKKNNIVENFYRFGGFANDCTRLALGLEQIQVQFSVKAWDFPAALFAHEAGLKVVMDPTGSKTDYAQWKVQDDNPLIVAPSSIVDAIVKLM